MANGRVGERERVEKETTQMRKKKKKKGARILKFGVNITDGFSISNELMKQFITLILYYR